MKLNSKILFEYSDVDVLGLPEAISNKIKSAMLVAASECSSHESSHIYYCDFESNRGILSKIEADLCGIDVASGLSVNSAYVHHECGYTIKLYYVVPVVDLRCSDRIPIGSSLKLGSSLAEDLRLKLSAEEFRVDGMRFTIDVMDESAFVHCLEMNDSLKKNPGISKTSIFNT